MELAVAQERDRRGLQYAPPPFGLDSAGVCVLKITDIDQHYLVMDGCWY